MARSSSADLERLATDAVVDAAAHVGIVAEPASSAASGADLILRTPGGGLIAVEVKAATTPSAAEIQRWAGAVAVGSRCLVVADRLLAGARRAANEAGVSWIDRRGHVRLVGEGLFVDADVGPLPRPHVGGRSDPIRGRAGVGLALALLMEPDSPPGTREIARRAGLSPSAISQARARLDEVSLIDETGAPLIPELFWALVDAWEASIGRVPVARLPAGDDLDRLGLRLRDLASEGWAAAGVEAAVAYGAPIVEAGVRTIDFYVPSASDLARASRRLGEGAGASAPARVAAAPSLLVVRPRYHHPSAKWPLVHPVAAALDLALDPSRGREALEQWEPSGEIRRVW